MIKLVKRKPNTVRSVGLSSLSPRQNFMHFLVSSNPSYSANSVSRRDDITQPEPTTYTQPKLLTECEVKILELVACDLTDKEIVERLRLSPRTINNALRRICAKLEAKGRTGAVVNAILKGFINPWFLSGSPI